MSKRTKKENHHDAGVFDDAHQLFLLAGQKINPGTYKLFADWRDANGPCIEWLDKKLDNPERNKRGYVLKCTIEALIDVYGRTVKTDPDFDLNSAITTYIMRHMIWREHHLGRPHRHLFECRQSPCAKVCTVCARRNRATARYCDHCGTRIMRKPPQSETGPARIGEEVVQQ
jgi:hypothetical protein